MRTNLPVTELEIILRDGESIASKTDIKGKITYVYPYFLEAKVLSTSAAILPPFMELGLDSCWPPSFRP